MKILVTGLSGCIGTAVCHDLAGKGHEVFAIVRDASAARLPENWQAIEADLSAPLVSSALPQRVDAVVHLAQSRRFREFPAAVGEVFAINTAATLALAEYAVKAGAGSYVYASTGSVYRPRPEPIREEDETAPLSFYAASKLAAEDLLAPFGQLMAVSIQRLFYVYGPGQRGMLTDGIATRIRNGEPITLHAPDGIAIAPTFAGDAARILRLAAEEKWCGTINVAGPDVVRLRQYAERIGAAIGCTPVFRIQDGGPPAPLLPDLSSLHERVPPGTFASIEDGLKQMFQ